jgi:hypothetical protein
VSTSKDIRTLELLGVTQGVESMHPLRSGARTRSPPGALHSEPDELRPRCSSSEPGWIVAESFEQKRREQPAHTARVAEVACRFHHR